MAAGNAGARRQNRWGEGALLREEILAGARRMLERDGTEETITLRGVAREAGIAAPSIYAHFHDRKALIDGVIAAVYADYVAERDRAQARLGADATARERLRAGVAAHIDFAHRHSASAKVLWTRPHPTAIPALQHAAMDGHRQLLAALAEAQPRLTEDQLQRRGQLVWATAHGLGALPPFHPRFPWADGDDLIDTMLGLYLQAEPGG